ncbi:MAG: hypothetical protein QOF00_5680 [Pseudonocardiales bacterium]|jgi:hypothetical protein|nr:hypothetical protein [Pseudonocardiales bacterium]
MVLRSRRPTEVSPVAVRPAGIGRRRAVRVVAVVLLHGAGLLVCEAQQVPADSTLALPGQRR